MLFYAKIGINIERETFFCQKDDNFSNNRLLPHFLRDSWLLLMSKGYLAVRGPRHIPFYASELIAKCLPITEACGVVAPSAWAGDILFILREPFHVITVHKRYYVVYGYLLYLVSFSHAEYIPYNFLVFLSQKDYFYFLTIIKTIIK